MSDCGNIVLKPAWYGFIDWTRGCGYYNIDKNNNIKNDLDNNLNFHYDINNIFPYYNERTEYIKNNAVFILPQNLNIDNIDISNINKNLFNNNKKQFKSKFLSIEKINAVHKTDIEKLNQSLNKDEEKIVFYDSDTNESIDEIFDNYNANEYKNINNSNSKKKKQK